MITPINSTSNNSNINFKAKFLYSDDLKKVVEYAVEKGKFDKLNQARKNIDSAYLTTKIKFEMFKPQNGQPSIKFSTYKPKRNANLPYSEADYDMTKTVEYINHGRDNLLKFALNKIIKLGNDAPHNNMYKNIIISNK